MDTVAAINVFYTTRHFIGRLLIHCDFVDECEVPEIMLTFSASDSCFQMKPIATTNFEERQEAFEPAQPKFITGTCRVV